MTIELEKERDISPVETSPVVGFLMINGLALTTRFWTPIMAEISGNKMYMEHGNFLSGWNSESFDWNISFYITVTRAHFDY